VTFNGCTRERPQYSQRRRGQEGGSPPGLKIFRASASCSKILNDKKYIFNTVNSGQTLFSGQGQSCSKILNDKKYFNTGKNFRETFFRASAS